MNDQLRKAQDVSLESLKGLFEGIQIGEIRSAEGESLSAIANSWLSVLSSLHEDRPGFAMVPAVGRAVEYGTIITEPVEQLANQIMHEVISNRAALEKFFSSDIRSGRLRRVRGKAHHVLIDYAGSQLVANFDVMKADRITKSVDSIKRRLWDLKVDRDQESSGLSQRRHEMLVQAPKFNDPTLSESQSSNVEDALGSLEEQADQEELRLVRLESTNAIAARVLEVEAA